MRRASGIAFDFYGTLAQPRPDDWWPQVRNEIAAAGGVIDEAAFAEWIAMPREHVVHSRDKSSYDAWSADRLRVFVAACGVTGDAQRGVVEDIERARQREVVAVVDGALVVLDELRRRGRRIVICSNWDWDLDRQLDANGLTSRVDAVICSARVGYRKPHASMFERVTAALGVPEDETVFVGDEWIADIAGARDVGMVPVHAAWAMRCAAEDHGDVRCCSSLSELLALSAFG